MTEQILCLSYSIIIIFIFSLIFNDKVFEYYYGKLKDKKRSWFWFDVFNIEKTKNNMRKFLRILSAFVIFVNFILFLFVMFYFIQKNF